MLFIDLSLQLSQVNKQCRAITFYSVSFINSIIIMIMFTIIIELELWFSGYGYKREAEQNIIFA